MLDQNTTAIITNGITAVSALLGSFGVLALSNRHVEKSERKKTKNAAIEETYQTLIRADKMIKDLRYDAISGNNIITNDGYVERLKAIEVISIRAEALVGLYMPSFKIKFEVYGGVRRKYCNAIPVLRYGKKGEPIKPEELQEEFDKSEKEYEKLLGYLQSELQKLVNEQKGQH